MAKNKNAFCPDYTVAPGEIAQEHLDLNGWSEEEFARKCKLPLDTINGVIAGTTRVTSFIAARFERILGVRADTWLSLEQMYREGLENGIMPIGHSETPCLNTFLDEVSYSAIS